MRCAWDYFARGRLDGSRRGAQWGTYGAPDPIPLGQAAPWDSYPPAMASRTSYVTAADGSGPTLIADPSAGIPPPPSESAAVSTMLNQPGTKVYPAAPCGTLPPAGYIREPGNCDTHGDVCRVGNGCCSPWYASFDALYMNRNLPNPVFTSYQYSNADNQGYFNNMDWTWGGQATLGYRFGCGCDWALEGTYWALAESDTDGGPNCSGPYATPMTFGLTNILGTGQQANAWTDGSPDHHIWLNWMAQDVEFNLVRTLWGGDCNRVGLDFLAGVRWFRFQDGLVFGAQRCGRRQPLCRRLALSERPHHQ